MQRLKSLSNEVVAVKTFRGAQMARARERRQVLVNTRHVGDNTGKIARRTLQVCALNGYGCVDTEYAWYQQQQQQQQQQHMSPYTSLLMASGADHVEDRHKPIPVYPAEYCPSCIALYAADADAAAVTDAANSG